MRCRHSARLKRNSPHPARGTDLGRKGRFGPRNQHGSNGLNPAGRIGHFFSRCAITRATWSVAPKITGVR
jgi:hypothetical protein